MRASALALLLWVAAMSTYPGWSALDPAATAFHPGRNFLCDLLSATTPDGQDNRLAATLMLMAAATVMFGGLLPAWWQVPGTAHGRRTARLMAILAAGLAVTICVEQGLQLALPHGPLTLAAGAAGLLPTALAMSGDWREGRTWLMRPLLGTFLVAALANLIGYAIVQLGGALTPVVPLAENAAFLLLLIWLALRGNDTDVPGLPRSPGRRGTGRSDRTGVGA
ncbi:MAG: hypothetical protein KDC98_05405 [Planctomycetes bacterium]|nr:hypothetical protein [Planctomycetota bacterium]